MNPPPLPENMNMWSHQLQRDELQLTHQSPLFSQDSSLSISSPVLSRRHADDAVEVFSRDPSTGNDVNVLKLRSSSPPSMAPPFSPPLHTPQQGPAFNDYE